MSNQYDSKQLLDFGKSLTDKEFLEIHSMMFRDRDIELREVFKPPTKYLTQSDGSMISNPSWLGLLEPQMTEYEKKSYLEMKARILKKYFPVKGL